jgi:hypothetical protein
MIKLLLIHPNGDATMIMMLLKDRSNRRQENVGQLWASCPALFAQCCQSNQITMDEREDAGKT